jgi:hypothetical protein
MGKYAWRLSMRDARPVINKRWELLISGNLGKITDPVRKWWVSVSHRSAATQRPEYAAVT